MRGGHLYYCVQARACHDNLGFDPAIGADDYLDLSKLDDSMGSKEKIMNFEMGYLDKGYLDMCNYCYGAERMEHPVQAAEQVTSKSVRSDTGYK